MAVIFCRKMTCFLKASENEELRHSTFMMISGSVFCMLVADDLGGVSTDQKFSDTDMVVNNDKR
jgi:hypothetical protein